VERIRVTCTLFVPSPRCEAGEAPEGCRRTSSQSHPSETGSSEQAWVALYSILAARMRLLLPWANLVKTGRPPVRCENDGRIRSGNSSGPPQARLSAWFRDFDDDVDDLLGF
jgi:hypothetical protein